MMSLSFKVCFQNRYMHKRMLTRMSAERFKNVRLT